MNLQGFMKMSLLDYPSKVAAVVFTGGCNLRCPFCHNATLVKNPFEVKNMTDEILDYLEKRRSVLDGVCITGGEPLLQGDIISFMEKLHALGYSVKLDTNGSLPARLKAVLDSGLVDYVAMDIKASPKKYSLAVGFDTDFAPYEESIKILKSAEVPYEFRTTAVKGIHDSDDFAEISSIIGDESYFIQKFTNSGNLINDSACSAFSDEEMENMRLAALTMTPRTKLRGV